MALTFEDIVKLPRYQKALIWLGILVFISTIFLYLSYLPRAKVLRQKNLQLTKKQSKLNELESVARELPKFKKEVAEMNERLKLALRQLPDSKEIPSLLANISSLGKESGLEFNLFQPKKEEKRGFYAAIPVQIEVTGGYHDVAIFFDKVGKLPRIVNITNIRMGNAKEVGGKTLLSTKCTAVTFRFLEKGTESVEKKKGRKGKKKSRGKKRNKR